jgi:hypothetical protein
VLRNTCIKDCEIGINRWSNQIQRVVEPGKMAGWIAPTDRGINKLPVGYEYVRLIS